MPEKFRLHVVGLPHTSVTLAYSACAFTERVRKFCGMMHSTLGHEVYLYAGPESDAECTEHIPCISEEERAAAVSGRHFVHASFDNNLPHWRAFNARVIEEIGRRIQPRDIICIIGGLAHKPILDAFPNHIGVEFSIGYGGNFAKFRVWESYAWMNTCLGAQAGNPNAVDIRWFDAVIGGSFEPDEFPFSAVKEPYHLFMGRVTERKGYRIAIDVCKRLGKRLIVAGQADVVPSDCEYVGVVGPEERGKLMAGAEAFWCPTIYSEPFGNVSIEAQLCGPPVICTDFGSFVENVEDGVTGFRCRSLSDFIYAAHHVTDLDPHYIRRRAIQNWSVDVIAKKYQRHFERLATLWGDGWYQV